MKEADAHAITDRFVIRPPRQERSRRAWARVLDAGVALFEEGGYEAFTIAAVCERARVAPRAIYDRTPSKEVLFVAVYEYRTSQIWEELRVFDDEEHWTGLDAPELIAALFGELAAVLRRHEAFLRALMTVSPAGNTRVYQQARRHTAQLAEKIVGLLLSAGPHIAHPDPETAVRVCFNAVYSALVTRIGCGKDLIPSVPDHDVFVGQLVEMAARYLLGSAADTARSAGPDPGDGTGPAERPVRPEAAN